MFSSLSQQPLVGPATHTDINSDPKRFFNYTSSSTFIPCPHPGECIRGSIDVPAPIMNLPPSEKSPFVILGAVEIQNEKMEEE